MLTTAGKRSIFSDLSSRHYTYVTCLSPFCSFGIANEENEYFLLHYQMLDSRCIYVLLKLSDVPRLDITKLTAKIICELPLYGSPLFNAIENIIILEAIISFLELTKKPN